MTSMLFLFTLWLVLSGICFYLGFALGGKKKKKKSLTTQEKNQLEREKRELLNFYTYNGDSQ